MPRFTGNSRVGTLVAFALIAAGLAGTIVDNNGRMGLALFVAGACGAVFLMAHQVARRLGGVEMRRPHVAGRGPIATIAGVRTIAIVAVAMGALLSATNVFKATDENALSRALNYGAWYGFLLLAVAMVGVSVAAAGRWLRSRPTEGTTP
jgi:hypothetical protein